MYTKFEVDWTSTSSKTTLTKNFNLKRDRRTNERTNRRTDEQTHRPENIMPLYYRRWGIKTVLLVAMQIILADVTSISHFKIKTKVSK